MSDNTEYKNIFETILTRYSWWSRLQGSQFVEMIATFVGQMVYKANAVSVRSLQEAFLSTATKRSSILASAEDKGYIGRKIMPSTGTSEVENLTNAVMSLPRSTPLISNAAIEYVTMAAVEIPPFGKIEIPVSQLVLKVLKTTVDQEDKFLEVILPKAITTKAHKVDVLVSTASGGYDLWQKSYMFRRTGARDKAYTEFYKPTDQLGIRFGNGINGKIPSANSEITLNVWTTEGDTTLIDDQPLEITGSLAYLNDSVKIKTVTPIVGGASAESDEETRAGALYVTPFDNQIVWDDDYSHYIKQNIANIIWVNAWGEQEQEKQDGVKNFSNINTIFISAYSTKLDQESLGEIVNDLLSGTDYLNKVYVYKPAVERPFTITIKGKASGEKDLVQVVKVIRETIDSIYGSKPTGERPDKILEKDVNALVRDLNLLHDFSLDWSAYPQNIMLEEYVFIDALTSNITVNYVEV
jgi:hypothetical protein